MNCCPCGNTLSCCSWNVLNHSCAIASCKYSPHICLLRDFVHNFDVSLVREFQAQLGDQCGSCQSCFWLMKEPSARWIATSPDFSNSNLMIFSRGIIIAWPLLSRSIIFSSISRGRLSRDSQSKKRRGVVDDKVQAMIELLHPFQSPPIIAHGLSLNS
jgi:hypothetical protein